MNLFQSMRAFVKIADKGSLSAAAKALAISPAMVGKHLHALEEHLGEVLIHRTTRRQNLTDFGQQYYSRCVEILGMVADAEALSSNTHNKPPSGKLAITAPLSFGSEALIPALHRFSQQYPEIDIYLSLNDRNVDLIADEIDVAIRIGKLPDSGLISRPLCQYTMVVCASPDYLKRYGKPSEPNELLQHRCIEFKTTSVAPWKFYHQDKTHRIKVKSYLHVDNGRALRKAALEGMGIIMQPQILLKEDIENKKLIPLLEQYKLPAREVHLLYLRNRNLPPKVRFFIDHVVDYFAGEPDVKKIV